MQDWFTFLLLWFPLVFAAYIGLVALIPGMQAVPEERSPNAAATQYLLLLSMPLIPLVVLLGKVGFVILGGLFVCYHSLRSSNSSFRTLTEFPNSLVTFLQSLLCLTTSIGLCLIVYFAEPMFTAVGDLHRKTLFVLGILLPSMVVIAIYHRQNWSWQRRGLSSGLLAFLGSAFFFFLSWHSCFATRIDHRHGLEIDDQGTLKYHVESQGLASLFNPRIRRIVLDKSGIHWTAEKDRYNPSPDGQLGFRLSLAENHDPGVLRLAGFQELRIVDRAGKELGTLNNCASPSFLKSIPPQWNDQSTAVAR